jgi:hypothetical protein
LGDRCNSASMHLPAGATKGVLGGSKCSLVGWKSSSWTNLNTPSLTLSANQLITHARHNNPSGARSLREEVRARAKDIEARASFDVLGESRAWLVCGGHTGPCSTTLRATL